MILGRVIQYLIEWADRLAEGPTGHVFYVIDYSASVSTPRWHRVNIPYIAICRCLDAKTSCKIKKASYSITNNCYRRHNK
jgi:hypothetical protein